MQKTHINVTLHVCVLCVLKGHSSEQLSHHSTSINCVSTPLNFALQLLMHKYPNTVSLGILFQFSGSSMIISLFIVAVR